MDSQGNLKGIPKLSKEENSVLYGKILNNEFYTNTHRVQVRIEKSKSRKSADNSKFYVVTRNLTSFIQNINEFSFPYIKRTVDNEVHEFFLVDYSDDSFTLMTHSYEGFIKKDKYPSIQNNVLLNYNYQGILISKVVLSNKIDNVNVECKYK